MTMGTAKGADGKKWDVDAGNYVRGAAGDIKVDYGKSGIAPPSSKIGVRWGLCGMYVCTVHCVYACIYTGPERPEQA